MNNCINLCHKIHDWINNGEIIAQKPTEELIQQFSGTAYTLELENNLDAIRASKIEALGGVVQAKTIYLSKPETLYQVFDILHPLPLVRVEKDQANLTEIFLKLVRGSNVWVILSRVQT